MKRLTICLPIAVLVVTAVACDRDVNADLGVQKVHVRSNNESVSVPLVASPSEPGVHTGDIATDEISIDAGQTGLLVARVNLRGSGGDQCVSDFGEACGARVVVVGPSPSNDEEAEPSGRDEAVPIILHQSFERSLGNLPQGQYTVKFQAVLYDCGVNCSNRTFNVQSYHFTVELARMT